MGKANLNAGSEKVKSEVRGGHVAPPEPGRTLAGKPQPHGYKQMNRNELN